jgi:hypothetical protein
MKNFRCHREAVDIHPVLAEIRTNQSAWAAQTGRQSRVAVQAQTNAIPLRGLRRSKIQGRRRRDVHESRYTNLASRFPKTVALLESLASDLGGDLGRTKFARLPPGARVLPHVDRGEYYACRDRYHLVIDSDGQSVLTAGNEEVRMRTGELWWFDNKMIHSASNGSDHPRTHLVFDVRPVNDRIPEHTQARPASDPRGMLNAIRKSALDSATEIVTVAVELYLAVRCNPSCWEAVLRDYDCVEQAQREPLNVLTQLILPERGDNDRKHVESAVAWALAQIDLGRLNADQIPKALADAGGVIEIHRAWRASRDQLLYGADRARLTGR